MAIELGTVAAIGFEDFPPEEWLGCFRRLGCTRVQAYRNQSANVTPRQMADAIAAGQMPCDSLHGVYGEKYDPSAPNEESRRMAVDAFKAEGELALELGGPLVVVHCSTIRRQGISDGERDVRIRQLGKSILELASFGAANDVQYAFENLPGYHAIGSAADQIAAWLDACSGENVGMCFDTGHAHMVGNVGDAIRGTGGRMIYLHASDNSGHADEHLMPTDGSIDWPAVAQALRDVHYDGTMMLEVFYKVDELNRLIDAGYGERLGEIVAAANDG
jgi:sugar phosphate isomerase/epimerase